MGSSYSTKTETPELQQVIVENVKTTFTPTGNYDQDKLRAEDYAKSVGMDNANAKMAVVMATQGPQVAAKAMMEDCGNDYFAMRMRYG